MTEIWAYQAANTIEITGDLAAKYWPNQLIKITQGTEKFFVIMGVGLVGGNTRLTVSGGGVYTLTSAAITAHHMTTNAAPVGLPAGFAVQGLAYGAASKDTPVDGDRLTLWDSAASFIQKGLTWANLKATLKTYFDTIYAAAASGVTGGDNHDHTGGDGAQIDHGGLGGLGDDDHAGYLLLAGRSGGQILKSITSDYNILTLAGTISSGNDNGGVISSRRKVQSNKPFSLLGSWDDGSYRLLCIGGGGWDIPDATRISFYVAPAYNETDNAGEQAMYIDSEKNVWIANNCSALSFTDRTDAFAGDALAAIEKIAADAEGNIDHSTLPEFARSTYRDADGEEQAGRDIGNMVSVLTTGMQQLIAENTALKERLKELEERIEA
jgi:hypothetical protein